MPELKNEPHEGSITPKMYYNNRMMIPAEVIVTADKKKSCVWIEIPHVAVLTLRLQSSVSMCVWYVCIVGRRRQPAQYDASLCPNSIFKTAIR